ncbi:uncharacterized protein LOC119066168 isoform X2 [Bradysia coprophila]|uniref:uncharacterized protein LOC119066168 isoform X2 n=1 Tax=Bradysia coprophila TaxID=38358 RepID=UPI00187DB040|nr:uncharacterized protein LOC119066168 isoform X2 [Bradysia coprophila]
MNTLSSFTHTGGSRLTYPRNSSTPRKSILGGPKKLPTSGTSRFAKGVLRLRGGMDSPDQSNQPVRSDSSPSTSRESTSDDDDTKEIATECFNESVRSMYDYLPLMVRQPIIVSDRIGRINSLIQILVPGIAIRHHFNNMDSTVRKVQRRVLRSVKNAADDLRSLITFYGNAQPGTEDSVKFDNLSSLQEELALFVAHFES